MRVGACPSVGLLVHVWCYVRSHRRPLVAALASSKRRHRAARRSLVLRWNDGACWRTCVAPPAPSRHPHHHDVTTAWLGPAMVEARGHRQHNHRITTTTTTRARHAGRTPDERPRSNKACGEVQRERGRGDEGRRRADRRSERGSGSDCGLCGSVEVRASAGGGTRSEGSLERGGGTETRSGD